MPHSKPHLRALYLQKRASISKEQALRASHAVTESLLAMLQIPPDSAIAGYVPIRHELDIMPALPKLHAKGHQTALPVIRHLHAPLSFHQWKTGDALVPSHVFKTVLEPSQTANTVQPAILLVPLVAFDRKGYRLGYGSGAYDRTLAALPDAITIGIAYSLQEVDELPHISFDQKVDYIITEKEVIQCQG